jgi:two-component system, NarL family, response regulator DevR
MQLDKTRLLLVDDHPVVCQGLIEEIEAEGDIAVIGVAASVAAATVLASQTHPEIVLTDMHLPDGTGADVCRQVRSQESHSHALILTGFDEDCDLWEALDARADGVIYKSADVGLVTQAVRQVMAGQRLWTEDQLQRAQRWWNEVGSIMSMLTMREREVLNLVAQGSANKDIATTLGIGLTSVETHLSHLLQKLDLKSRQEMTAFVWRHRLTDCLQRNSLKE